MAHKNKENFSPYKERNKARALVMNSEALKGVHKKPETIYSAHEANDRLADIFRNHDFECTHALRIQLARFYEILMKNQEHQNFTRLLKLRDVAIKHFIDCLIIPQMVELKFPLLDVGTGPGFPGIPLKFFYPDEKIILAEGVQKRVAFLKDVREQMDLKNCDIIGRNINKYFEYPVNGVITRAVEDIKNTLTNTLSCLQVGGEVYFMKGPGVDPEIEAALNHFDGIFDLTMNKSYQLPKTGHDRRLVVFKKVKLTPLPDDEDNDILLKD
jgi:16S rRNA (guanine527-N7)-methyltransferase